MRAPRWAVAAPLLLAAPLAAQETPPGPAAWDDFAAWHRAALDSAGVVGATIAFVRDGGIAAVDYYGMADLGEGRPVDAATIYHWASVTKTFTAVALMQLRDRGLLDLDDPIVASVPELRGVHNPYGAMEDVTIRHLLSHSSGFRNPTWPWDEGADWQPFEPTEWSQLVAMVPYTQLQFPPGSRYSYSNPGLIFVGRAIEHHTGDVYEHYVEKNLLDALDMETAYFDATPWRLRGARSNSYRVVAGEPVARGREFNTGITVSNGGLNATVGDMAKWIAFLSGRPTSDRGRHDAVLARATLEEMWEPIVTVDDSELGEERVGLGFFLYGRAGRRLVGHTGSQHSFRTFILVDPAAGTGVLAAWNTADGDGSGPDTDTIRTAAMARAIETLFAPRS